MGALLKEGVVAIAVLVGILIIAALFLYTMNLRDQIATQQFQLEEKEKALQAYAVAESTNAVIERLRTEFNTNLSALQTNMKEGFKNAKQNDPAAKKWAGEPVPCSVLATDVYIPESVWLRHCAKSGLTRAAVPASAKIGTNADSRTAR